MEKLSDALKYVKGKIADLEDDLQHYTMVDKDKCKEFYIREDLKQFNNILESLQELQTIKETKSSEALKDLECLKLHISARDMLDETSKKIALDICNDIEKDLLNVQESEKVLEILFEKNVNMSNLAIAVHNNSLRLYNGSIPDKFKYFRLTQEEFDTLKKWKKRQKN